MRLSSAPVVPPGGGAWWLVDHRGDEQPSSSARSAAIRPRSLFAPSLFPKKRCGISPGRWPVQAARPRAWSNRLPKQGEFDHAPGNSWLVPPCRVTAEVNIVMRCPWRAKNVPLSGRVERDSRGGPCSWNAAAYSREKSALPSTCAVSGGHGACFRRQDRQTRPVGPRHGGRGERIRPRSRRTR